LARAENTAPAAQTASVADIVALALRAAEGSARLRGVALVCPDLPLDAELAVAGVTRELSRALRNLVDNAVAHSKTDDRVHVRVSALEARIEISVQDDGPGVPNADREQIFEPFFRGARERGQTDQGVGLGLSIAREIARRLGGDVVLDSSCASGARFVLQLPRPVEIHA
jgi:signal transduction histidine kinase